MKAKIDSCYLHGDESVLLPTRASMIVDPESYIERPLCIAVLIFPISLGAVLPVNNMSLNAFIPSSSSRNSPVFVVFFITASLAPINGISLSKKPEIICETPHPKVADPPITAGTPPIAPTHVVEANAPPKATTPPLNVARVPFPTAPQFTNPKGSSKFNGSFRTYP